MRAGPLGHQSQRALREGACEDSQRIELERGLVLSVPGMEMRAARVVGSSWYIQITIP